MFDCLGFYYFLVVQAIQIQSWAFILYSSPCLKTIQNKSSPVTVIKGNNFTFKINALFVIRHLILKHLNIVKHNSYLSQSPSLSSHNRSWKQTDVAWSYVVVMATLGQFHKHKWTVGGLTLARQERKWKESGIKYIFYHVDCPPKQDTMSGSNWTWTFIGISELIVMLACQS